MKRFVPVLILFSIGAVPVLAQSEADDALEKSVNKALAFLTQMQETDGSWRLTGDKNPASTGLAVMAFLSAGHVPGEGKYGEVIEKGIRWMVAHQHPSGLLTSATHGGQGYVMYQHGIGTLMLAEVYGMTDDKLAPKVKQALEKAIKLILTAQRTQGVHRGGWRYDVGGNDSDMSVTGWQLLALKAAKNVGCDIPAERIKMSLDFIKNCNDKSSGGFCYMPGAQLTVPCTGTAILCLELCEGHDTYLAKRAGGYLLKHPPAWSDFHFFYNIYYCSQATFQLGGNYWEFYKPRLHKLLLPQQKTNGSWLHPQENHYGPVYSTAMAVLALTVEYRYLPIYQRGDD